MRQQREEQAARPATLRKSQRRFEVHQDRSAVQSGAYVAAVREIEVPTITLAELFDAQGITKVLWREAA